MNVIIRTVYWKQYVYVEIKGINFNIILLCCTTWLLYIQSDCTTNQRHKIIFKKRSDVGCIKFILEISLLGHFTYNNVTMLAYHNGNIVVETSCTL